MKIGLQIPSFTWPGGDAEIAPRLKWIHCIGAGVEHLCPMDWVPEGVTITNNKGAHADKAGEYALMAVLMRLFRRSWSATLERSRSEVWTVMVTVSALSCDMIR